MIEIKLGRQLSVELGRTRGLTTPHSGYRTTVKHPLPPVMPLYKAKRALWGWDIYPHLWDQETGEWRKI